MSEFSLNREANRLFCAWRQTREIRRIGCRTCPLRFASSAKAPRHAGIFRSLQIVGKHYRLCGGEREIRTPETLQIRGRNLAVPRSCGSLNHIVYAVCQDVAHFARECELSSALYASVFSASNQLSSIFPCRCPPRFRPFDPSCILIPNFRRRV